MNKIYKVVKNGLGLNQAVGELAKGAKKGAVLGMLLGAVSFGAVADEIICPETGSCFGNQEGLSGQSYTVTNQDLNVGFMGSYLNLNSVTQHGDVQIANNSVSLKNSTVSGDVLGQNLFSSIETKTGDIVMTGASIDIEGGSVDGIVYVSSITLMNSDSTTGDVTNSNNTVHIHEGAEVGSVFGTYSKIVGTADSITSNNNSVLIEDSTVNGFVRAATVYSDGESKGQISISDATITANNSTLGDGLWGMETWSVNNSSYLGESNTGEADADNVHSTMKNGIVSINSSMQNVSQSNPETRGNKGALNSGIVAGTNSIDATISADTGIVNITDSEITYNKIYDENGVNSNVSGIYLNNSNQAGTTTATNGQVNLDGATLENIDVYAAVVDGTEGYANDGQVSIAGDTKFSETAKIYGGWNLNEDVSQSDVNTVKGNQFIFKDTASAIKVAEVGNFEGMNIQLNGDGEDYFKNNGTKDTALITVTDKFGNQDGSKVDISIKNNGITLTEAHELKEGDAFYVLNTNGATYYNDGKLQDNANLVNGGEQTVNVGLIYSAKVSVEMDDDSIFVMIPVEPNNDLPVDPMEPNNDLPVDPMEPNNDLPVDPMEPNNDLPVDPMEPNNDLPVDPMEPNNDLPVDPMEPNNDLPVDPMEPNNDLPVDPMEPNNDLPVDPMEPNNDLPVDPMEPNNDLPVDPMEPNNDLPNFLNVDENAIDRLSPILDSQIAAMTTLNQGNTLSNDILIDIEPTKKGDIITFGKVSSGHTKAKGTSDININGLNLIVGAGYSFSDKTIVGGFFEYGYGHYDSTRDFDGYTNGNISFDALHYKGKGNVNYEGLGALIKHYLNDGLYLNASAKVGSINTNYSSTSFTDNDYRASNMDFSKSKVYFGTSAGGGYKLKFDEKQTLNSSLNFIYTQIGGHDLTIDESKIKMDKVKSERLRLDENYSYQLNDLTAINLSAAFDYEFGGKAKGTVDGYDMTDSSVRGGTGSIGAGVRFTPFDHDKDKYIELSAYGSKGKIESVGGSVSFNYNF